jgi:glycosyltransferase involved in cell wall biosynthesis
VNDGSPIELSIVIPAFNERENVPVVVEESLAYLDKSALAGKYELIVVNDGSTDGTREVADEEARKHASVRAVHHERNRGFGAAQLSGFAAARGRYVTLIPGDGQVKVDQAVNLYQEVQDADIILSERRDPTAVHASSFRRLLTRMSRRVIRTIGGLDMSKLEGIFVAKTTLLRELDLKTQSGYLSAEIILKCQKQKRAMRHGVTYIAPRLSGHSKVTNARHVAKAVTELVKMRLAIRRE